MYWIVFHVQIAAVVTIRMVLERVRAVVRVDVRMSISWLVTAIVFGVLMEVGGKSII